MRQLRVHHDDVARFELNRLGLAAAERPHVQTAVAAVAPRERNADDALVASAVCPGRLLVKMGRQRHVLTIVELLAIVANPSARDADRIRAMEILFERGWGKAPQAVDLNVNQGASAQLAALEPDELQAVIAYGREILAKVRAEAKSGQVRPLPERSSRSSDAAG